METNSGFNHKSVLLEESIRYLNIKKDGIYVDGTLGGGGHSYEICKNLSEEGMLIGIDQDSDAIEAARTRLEAYNNRVRIVRDNYSNIKEVLRELKIDRIDGMILDLGVSSYQLDTIQRGFTYKVNAPLDMRMDQRQTKTAKDIVNEYSEAELFRIIRDYGEDRFAKNIAKHIVRMRNEKELMTTDDLTEAVKVAIPKKLRVNKGHPAKKTFQAIRIELNRELEVLEHALGDIVELLSENGRLCVITFHSLEDKIVKSAFRKFENPCTCPAKFPICVCNQVSKGKVITRKPILPSELEIGRNKRAKSAKLRVFEYQQRKGE